MPFPRQFLALAGAALALNASVTLGQTLSGSLDTQKSELAYTGSHPLHGWTGVSKAVTGSVHVDVANPSGGRVEISVPVESFDSGNGNRDSNMLDAVEVDRYPDVEFVSERIEVVSWQTVSGGHKGEWVVHGNLTFHGKTHPVSIPTDVAFDGTVLQATGGFSIELDQFDVKRPRLLLWSISNDIKLEGKLSARLSATP